MKYSLHLYEPEEQSNLNFEELEVYLRDYLNVDIRMNPFTTVSIDIEQKFKKIRIRDIRKGFEEQPLQEPEDIGHILYDGFQAIQIFNKYIEKVERNRNNIHLFFTNRLIGTYGDDLKYHARINIIGCPSLISLPGVIEAPARAMEYYITRGRLQLVDPGKSLPDDREIREILKEAFKERSIDFLVYNDERLTEVVKGYVMQAVFYHVFKEGFCEDKNCRLYNAHRQEEMIHAQFSKPDFCEKHKAMKEGLAKGRDTNNEKI